MPTEVWSSSATHACPCVFILRYLYRSTIVVAVPFTICSSAYCSELVLMTTPLLAQREQSQTTHLLKSEGVSSSFKEECFSIHFIVIFNLFAQSWRTSVQLFGNIKTYPRWCSWCCSAYSSQPPHTRIHPVTWPSLPRSGNGTQSFPHWVLSKSR